MGRKEKLLAMKTDTLEYVLAVTTLPAGMEWLESKLQWIDHPEWGRVVIPTLVKQGRYHTIPFTVNDVRGLALNRITGRVREGIAMFELRLEKGTAPKLKVVKAEGEE